MFTLYVKFESRLFNNLQTLLLITIIDFRTILYVFFCKHHKSCFEKLSKLKHKRTKPTSRRAVLVYCLVCGVIEQY